MPTGHDLLRSAYRFRGEPYSTDPGRTSQTSGYKDCSGLVYAALVGVGINPGGNTVSTTLETWAVRNGGHYITRQEALWLPGAGIAIWGIGSQGHIGLSVGNGSQAFETPSAEGRRVGFSPFNRNNWGRFFTWPGIGTASGPGTPAPPPPISRTGFTGMIARHLADGAMIWFRPGLPVEHIGDPKRVDRLRWYGVAYAGDATGEDIRKYARDFGAPEGVWPL